MRLFLSRSARRALHLGPPSTSDWADSLSVSFRAARSLAERLSGLLAPDESRPSAGQLYALGRLEQALRFYLERSLTTIDPTIIDRALAKLDLRFGGDAVNRLLGTFEDDFLPARSDRADKSVPNLEFTEPHRRELLGELLIFSIVESNGATKNLGELLYSGKLVTHGSYASIVGALAEELALEPGLLAGDDSLIEGLRRPIDAAPDSITDQLRWLIENWSHQAPDLKGDLTAALDLITEEEKPRFPPGPGPTEAPVFEHLEQNEVRYGSDRSWMSTLVLAAKNTYVWLHQLSIRHNREISKLDQIPETELAKLAECGITGLWLIGLWERSPASRRIKQLCGNPEAAGSAYSLTAYRIAEDLGGEEALDRLAELAGSFGIRLSADMVPNHTGIDSEWLIEHPEWFLSVPVCPFPSYTFDGPDLSNDPRVSIFLEDHYFDRSDAAVIFKRVENSTGEIRYVYHGNDGTSTPWNDTAQLDYLNPETREAVTSTIMEVARRFPIIRFDAAMTLARKHIQRLWHPERGSAGAIPSRAEQAMTATEFNSFMPREFWRDVVDRAETEAPDTLLLAEAFWLMEGYFVRNLGLHRVYNSAFMNMLRAGDNRGYRKLVRESLAFDPEILKRHVNFLSNPDERTAIEQFGDGDRYIGASVLLATMPGLPMIAHGQIEGFTERYGMEYRRSYVDETPDQALLERHETSVFPLLRERQRFTEIETFAMHDFIGSGGEVLEDVLAFSHGSGSESAIVVFNNQPRAVRGVLRLDRDLGISGSENRICTFSDQLSGRRFLRTAAAIMGQGLELDLAAFESSVLIDFREVVDDEDLSEELCRHLDLRGTPDLKKAARNLAREERRTAFAGILERLLPTGTSGTSFLEETEHQLAQLAHILEDVSDSSPGSDPGQGDESGTRMGPWLGAIPLLGTVESDLAWPATQRMLTAHDRFLVGSEKEIENRIVLVAFAVLGALRQGHSRLDLAGMAPGQAVESLLTSRGSSNRRARELGTVVNTALARGWLDVAEPPGRAEAAELLSGTRAEGALSFPFTSSSAEGTFEIEALDRFLMWRGTAAALSWLADDTASRSDAAEAVVGWCDALERLRDVVTEANQRVDAVLVKLLGD